MSSGNGCELVVSINAGTPKWMVYNRASSKNDDFLGYPHFRKPPNGRMDNSLDLASDPQACEHVKKSAWEVLELGLMLRCEALVPHRNHASWKNYASTETTSLK